MSGPADNSSQRAVGACPGPGGREGRPLPAQVAANDDFGGAVRLTVVVPGWPGARPGQFALLRARPSHCFLARALSVADEAGESVTFLIAPVGDGTRELSGLRPGDSLSVLGPLGNGFDLEALVRGPGRVVIVAGGVGVAPFPLLLTRLAARYREVFPSADGDEPGSPTACCAEVLVLAGFRDSGQYEVSTPVREAARRLGESGLRCRVELVVEDGSRGPGEKATDLLERHIQPGDRIVVCGPWAMSEAVWRVCAAVAGVQVWFSLETAMACGVGSCHGCVVTLADGSYARVCHEGPVFSGRELFGG